MADLNYSLGIDTKGAERALSGIQSLAAGVATAIAGSFATVSLGRVITQFQDLRTSLQILYKDTAVGSRVFEDIKNFASETAFSVQDLTETVIKLKAAGIDPTLAQLRLFADVSAVTADKIGALTAITDLYARTTAGGLGLEDLNRLQDRGIPVFDIIAKKTGLARLEISRFGQTAEGATVILQALEAGLSEQFSGASAARAQNLSQAISNLGDTVSNAIDLVGELGLTKAITDLTKAFANLINENKAVIVVIGVALTNAFELLAENIGLVTIAATTLFAVLAVGAIVRIAQAFLLLNGVIGKNPIVKLLGVVTGLAAGLGIATVATDDFSVKMAELDSELSKLESNKGGKELKEGKLADGTQNFRQQVSQLNEQVARFRVEMNGIAESFARYNRETVQSIQLETSLIGTSSELRRVRQSELEINQRAQQEIAKLRESKAKLSEQERKEGRGQIIDATIKKIEEQTEIDKQSAASAIQSSENRINARKLEEFAINRQIDVNKDLRKIQDDINKSTLSEMGRRQYDILAAARERAEVEIAAEQARRGALLTDQEKLKFYDEAVRGTEELIAKEQELFDKSRQFSTSWKRAFQEYADNATNAARQAERIFQQATQGMEDMIVNFAKTGKFEFKGFLNSILEDLLRSQIRQLMAQVLGGVGGGNRGADTGILGSIGNLLGFANGGVIPTNGPVIVGERGPEILTGAAGRTVIPNNQLGGQTVVYNINAVDASSFKSLVARDPAFIHAVAMQGAKSVPTRR